MRASQEDQQYQEERDKGKKKGRNPWIVAAIWIVTAILAFLILYF